MSDFSVEISVKDDGKIVSLDTDEMDICIYQETGNGKTRVLDITCDKSEDDLDGTLLTKIEFVGAEDDLEDLTDLNIDAMGATMEIYTNKYGGP